MTLQQLNFVNVGFLLAFAGNITIVIATTADKSSPYQFHHVILTKNKTPNELAFKPFEGK